MTEKNTSQIAPNTTVELGQPTGKSIYIFIILLVIVTGAITTFIWRSQKAPVSEPVATAENKNPAGIVKFLMEQQWLIRMKLTKVEQKSLARQVTAVGRVVPAASSRAIVAPSIGGILGEGKLPVIGQSVSQGQTLAVLRQTPTAAETAQIASSNVQLQIETMKLEAEKRRLTQAIGEAQARVEQAKAEYERAQRLYERKAYSLRQLQIAETD
jgi:multidrug efflux pump subunit AcrA (membrane-fusion protein)